MGKSRRVKSSWYQQDGNESVPARMPATWMASAIVSPVHGFPVIPCSLISQSES